MGNNNSAAIMLGVKSLPAEVNMYTDDDDLLESYRDETGSDYHTGIATPYDADIPVVGVYVAIGGSGKDGITDLRAFALASIETEFVKEIERARKEWRKFAAWMKKRGHVLDDPELFFTLTETA